MRAFLFTLLLASLAFSALAQPSRTIYFTSEGKVTTKAGASYYSTITRSKTDTARFAVETFYASGARMSGGGYRGQRFPVAWERLHEPPFLDALRDGAFKEHFESGQPRFEGAFKNGRGEGPHRRWYESGKLLSEATLVAGREESRVTVYFESGKVKTQYTAKAGLPEGELLEYYEDGRKRQKATFSSGKMVGEPVLFDAEGNEIRP